MGKVSNQIQKTFARWGRSGGQLRAKRLSSSERSHIASQAARARWKSKLGLPRGEHLSVRLHRADWANPVYLEEVLSDGSLSDWRALYHRVADFPFGDTASALARVLEASAIYGVTPLWQGILRTARGGVM